MFRSKKLAIRCFRAKRKTTQNNAQIEKSCENTKTCKLHIALRDSLKALYFCVSFRTRTRPTPFAPHARSTRKLRFFLLLSRVRRTVFHLRHVSWSA